MVSLNVQELLESLADYFETAGLEEVFVKEIQNRTAAQLEELYEKTVREVGRQM